MVHDVFVTLAGNSSSTAALYPDSLLNWNSIMYTSDSENNTLENVTFLASLGRIPHSSDTAHSFLSKLRQQMNDFVVPAAISVGILGNLLLVLVFMCTPLRYSALCHYLTALGISDLIYLLSCMAVWITGRGVRLQNTMGVCQITMFALLLFRFLDTWYLFAAHVERAVVQFGPDHVKKWCTTFRTKCIIVIIFVFSLVGFSHYMWIHVVIEYRGIHSCLLMQESRKHIIELGKVEVLVASFLPMLLIVVLDVSIIVKLVAECGLSICDWGSAFKDKDVREECGPAHEAIAIPPSGAECQGSNLQPSQFSISVEKTRATLLVVVEGLIFIALTLPSSMFRAKQYFSHLARPSRQDMEMMFFTEEIVMFNSVYKIFLYLVGLGSFRRALVYLYRHRCRQPTEAEVTVPEPV